LLIVTNGIDNKLPESKRLEALLSKVTWLSKQQFSNEIGKFSLTAPQFSVLRCLHETENAQTMSQLTQECMAVMPTMTGIIDRLAARGLVERQRDVDDRRSLIISITSSGRKLIEDVTRHRSEQVNKFLITLSNEECISMIDLLQRYLDQLLESIDIDKELNEKE
jgi:DNA-binding MarR family transcriptional regulator